MKLQFIEIANGETNKVYLDELNHVIGHEGDIKPLISNGHISRLHAKTVKIDGGWVVSDGVEAPSRNGLFFQDLDMNSPEKINKSAVLSVIGQKVYLLSIKGNQAYLEVVEDEPIKCEPTGRNTAGLELQIQELVTHTEKAVEKIKDVKSEVIQNREEISELKTSNTKLANEINLALDTIEEIGSNPKQYIFGALTLSGMILLGLILWGAFKNLDQVMNRILYNQDKIERQIKQAE